MDPTLEPSDQPTMEPTLPSSNPTINPTPVSLNPTTNPTGTDSSEDESASKGHGMSGMALVFVMFSFQ